MAIAIRWTGFEKVRADVAKASVRYRTPSQVRKVLRPPAGSFRDHLRNTVKSTFAGSDRSTGNLARSIRILQFKGRQRNPRALFVGANLGNAGRYPDGYYFGFQDRGTSKIRGRHMMDRTYTAFGNSVANEMARALLRDLKYML